jgi:hypothetical protein
MNICSSFCRGTTWHQLRQEDFSQIDLDDSPELLALIKSMMKTDPAQRVDIRTICANPVISRARSEMERAFVQAKLAGHLFLLRPLWLGYRTISLIRSWVVRRPSSLMMAPWTLVRKNRCSLKKIVLLHILHISEPNPKEKGKSLRAVVYCLLPGTFLCVIIGLCCTIPSPPIFLVLCISLSIIPHPFPHLPHLASSPISMTTKRVSYVQITIHTTPSICIY